MKNKNCIIRLSDQDSDLIQLKASILNINKSKLFRDAALTYWGTNKSFNPNQILTLYKASDDPTKDNIIWLLVEYFRRVGYPHRKLSKIELLKEMHKLVNTKSPLLADDHLQSNTVGLTIANYFHPHMVKVKCLKNYHSPYEVFSDDDLLFDAIKRWFDLGYKPSLSGIRRILRTRDGVRSVVNWKPVIAKAIYDIYCPVGGKVLDPCAGYGGRLTGLIAANKGALYHGLDPNPDVGVGNMKLAAFYAGQYEGLSDRPIWSFGFRFDLGCAEDIMPGLPENSYDLIMSSPPYHSIEKYSLLPNQSYLRYPEYETWRDKFLFALVLFQRALNLSL